MMHSYYKIEDLRKILDACAEKYDKDLGEPNKLIESYDSYGGLKEVVNQCRIYQKAKKFIIITSTKLYVIPFSKIIGYDIIDKNKGDNPLYRSTTITTKSDNGDVVKRAIIGGAIAGGVGAIIGGLTASKTTSNQSTVEEYAAIMNKYISSIPVLELTLGLDDLLSPSIKIPFGENKKEIEEFAATLNVVIKRNVEITENDESEIIYSSPAIRSTGKDLGIVHRDPFLEIEKKEIEEKELISAKNKEDSGLAQIIIIIMIIGFFFLLIFLFTCNH